MSIIRHENVPLDESSKDEALPDPPRKPLWKLFVKLFVSFGAIFLIYTSVDFSDVIDVLTAIRARTVVLIALLYVIGQCMSTAKWRVLLTEIGLRRSLWETLRAYFFGMFVNTAGIGTVGGDVARALMLRPPAGTAAAAIASVVADRIHGLTVLFAIGIAALYFSDFSPFGPLADSLSLPILFCMILAWWLGPRVAITLLPNNRWWSESIIRALSAFPQTAKPLGMITLISIAIHSLQIYMHFIIARELGVDLSLAFLFATIPFVNIVSALPLSINGLGIREAAYIFIFSSANVPNEISVALGAVWFATTTVVSLFGGLVVLLSRPKSTASISVIPATDPRSE